MENLNKRTAKMIRRFSKRYHFSTSSSMAEMYKRMFLERAYRLEKAKNRRLLKGPDTPKCDELRKVFEDREEEYTDALDDLVHTLAATLASSVNNQGSDEQINFIAHQLGDETANQVLLDILVGAKKVVP